MWILINERPQDIYLIPHSWIYLLLAKLSIHSIIYLDVVVVINQIYLL